MGARVTSASVARTVERLMRAVVRGDRRRGRDPGRAWPARRGRPSCARRSAADRTPPSRGLPADQAADPTDTDAWFAAYAPAEVAARGRRSACRLSGPAGGETAAPAARDVLVAALDRHRLTQGSTGVRRLGYGRALASDAGRSRGAAMHGELWRFSI